MTTQTTFYLSQILGKKIFSPDHELVGKIQDLLIDPETARPQVSLASVIVNGHKTWLDFSSFEIRKENRKLIITAYDVSRIKPPENYIYLGKNILDKQIVDLNGRKIVRVNDIRIVYLSSGCFVIAADIGIEGLLRRLGVDYPINLLLMTFRRHLSTKFIKWDDVGTINPGHASIQLSRTYSKLKTFHPSDLADIIEDLNKESRQALFSLLEEDRAADVLEEMEEHTQVEMIESLSTEKAADVLEKMPADEAADILDVLEEDKSEELLKEMEHNNSEEIRELLRYHEKSIGSIMSTDYLTFNQKHTVAEVFNELRWSKPSPDSIYTLLITDNTGRLKGTITLMEIVVADPGKKLSEIMNRNLIQVYDDDKIDILSETISKYNLLAVPVVDHEDNIRGIVVIDDIIEDLLKERKTA
ncbi:MAG: CBS domain-containing protein [Bacteroidota bacterium]|nr:CBS domain-containing protein [Bacteroidota bacterium]